MIGTKVKTFNTLQNEDKQEQFTLKFCCKKYEKLYEILFDLV